MSNTHGEEISRPRIKHKLHLSGKKANLSENTSQIREEKNGSDTTVND